MENDKSKRFRFSEAERIRAVKETFNILCEEECGTEEELWKKVHDVLMYDNPRRFEHCSTRLLRSHMLEQVSRFKKYDSDEATESGKERLQSPWGDALRTLITVWDNYERIVQNDNSRKSSQCGRPKKSMEKQRRKEADLAKAIRDAVLQFDRPTYAAQELELANDDISTQQSDELEVPINTQESERIDEEGDPLVPESVKTTIRPATKRRKPKDNGVFQYLDKKNQLEMEIKREELNTRNAQHKDNMKFQMEELEYKKAKLEFEKEKWQVEVEERRAEVKKSELMFKLLQKLIENK